MTGPAPRTVRWLIGYGRELASTVQQRANTPEFAPLARRFRIADLAVILARITRGLMLAGALEAMLAQRAVNGGDVTPTPCRGVPPEREQPDDDEQYDDSEPAVRRAPRYTNIVDLPLDRLPTEEEIAAELLRRPIGAIIADICRDLAIMPGDIGDVRWLELVGAITDYGGRTAALFKEAKEALLGYLDEYRAGGTPEWPVPYAPEVAPVGTGPP